MSNSKTDGQVQVVAKPVIVAKPKQLELNLYKAVRS